MCYNIAHRRPSTPQLQNIDAPLDVLESSLDGENLAALCYLRRMALSRCLAVYLVGGPVRDVLMGRPVRDLDFAVEGDGPEVAQGLASELGGEVLVHPRFGAARLVMGGTRIDVVTARRESYSQPAALPDVVPGRISDDLGRRDFSINALALPLGDRHPLVMDPHGGLVDISGGLVRTLHSNSFVDDPTRIFRAIRYEQRLEFSVEKETLAQLLSVSRDGYLASLTGDRIRHELERMLRENQPELPMIRLAQLGILADIHPSLGDEHTGFRLAAVASPGSGEGSILDLEIGAGPMSFVSALAYPLSEEEGQAVIHRLNMPGSWAKAVRHTIQVRELEGELAKTSMSPSQLDHLLERFHADLLLSVSRLTKSWVVAQNIRNYLNGLSSDVPMLSGRDLLAIGVPEGPMLGLVLRELRDAKLNGQVSTVQEERCLVEAAITRRERMSEHGYG